jgi:hypothetical protein
MIANRAGGKMLGRRGFGMAAASWLAAPAISRADSWPSARVTIVVPFPAGAATDLAARLYAEQLRRCGASPSWSTTRAAATASRPAEAVARAKPDGPTLFATSAMTQAVNPALYDKLRYDPIGDFEPITRMGTSPFVLLVDRQPDQVGGGADGQAQGEHRARTTSAPARCRRAWPPSSTRWRPESRRFMSVTRATRRRSPICRAGCSPS